jgi:hypothetical protein
MAALIILPLLIRFFVWTVPPANYDTDNHTCSQPTSPSHPSAPSSTSRLCSPAYRHKLRCRLLRQPHSLWLKKKLWPPSPKYGSNLNVSPRRFLSRLPQLFLPRGKMHRLWSKYLCVGVLGRDICLWIEIGQMRYALCGDLGVWRSSYGIFIPFSIVLSRRKMIIKSVTHLQRSGNCWLWDIVTPCLNMQESSVEVFGGTREAV